MSRRMTIAAQDMVHGVFAAKEARLSQHVPYAAFLDPETISTRNGDLMRVFEVGGLPFETAEADELEHRSRIREQFIRRALGPRSGFYHHVVRRPGLTHEIFPR